MDIFTKRNKLRTNIILIIIALLISMSMMICGWIFTNITNPEAAIMEDVIVDQLEGDASKWSIYQEPIGEDNTKQQSLSTYLKPSVLTDIIKDGRALQTLNTNIVNNNTQIYLYDSQELLDTNEDYPWGHIYKSRIWCSVLTMWPERRQNIEAVANTWAQLCDRIIFVVDNSTSKPPIKPPKNETSEQRKKREKRKKGMNKIEYEWEEAPESYLGFDFLKLAVELPQSEGWRNIWEKSWKTWHHVGTNHINDSEWFLKIDDDTFFSPINFVGFARYYNPNKPWYFGNTLMHLWKSRNIVFNSGSCYALSRGALSKLVKVFESESFQNPTPDRLTKGQGCKCFCVKRKGAFEDPSMGVCLHSIGIDPSNTMDKYNRERFSPFRKSYHKNLKWKSSFWYFHLKPTNIGIKEECCAEHPISFHFYKHDKVKMFKTLHETHNINEGVNGKTFQVPLYPRPFLHREDLNFTVDKWRNSFSSAVSGQLVYRGPGNEKSCWKCEESKK